MTSRSVFIGIAGGTASGKTTLALLLQRARTSGTVQVITLDSYYRSRPELTLEQRTTQNYDHPDAFEIGLLIRQLQQLAHGRSVEVPIYNFATHLRATQTEHVEAAEYVVVEGILTFHWPELREMFDLKVFVETSDTLRFERRLERDMRERGRTRESVITQWKATVQPMHEQFCLPSKAFADVVYGGEVDLEAKVDEIFRTVLKVRR